MLTWRVQCPQFAWEHILLCHWNKAKYSNQQTTKLLLPTSSGLCGTYFVASPIFSLCLVHMTICAPSHLNTTGYPRLITAKERRAHLAALKLEKILNLLSCLSWPLFELKIHFLPILAQFVPPTSSLPSFCSQLSEYLKNVVLCLWMKVWVNEYFVQINL